MTPMKSSGSFSGVVRALLVGIMLPLASQVSGIALGAESELASENLRSSDLFKLTNVWTVHLRFAPDQWSAMQPSSAAPTATPVSAGPAIAGPGALLGPVFVHEADANKDGRVSKPELSRLAERWFASWSRAGNLSLQELSTGLSQPFSIPNLLGASLGMPVRSVRDGERFTLQGAEGERNGLAARLGFEFEYVPADLEFGGIQLSNVAVRYKGNGTFVASRNSLKRPLKIDFNDYVKGHKLAGLTKINLHNNVSDPSWMNEPLSFRLFRDAGVPASRTAFAKVYVTVPGQFDRQYFGLYSLVENVDQQFAQERSATKEGTFFKPSTPELFADLGSDWENYKQTYDPKDEPSALSIGRLLEFVQLLSKATDREFAARAGEFIDLDEFARFMAVTVSLSALDSILGVGQNYYLYFNPKSQKFQFIPWDEDHSFGQLGGSQPQRENLSIQQPWQGQNRFLERMFAVRAFKDLYLKHLSETARTLFTPKRLALQVDEIAAAIRPAVKEESAEKLAALEAAVTGRSSGRNEFGITRGAKPINAFMPLRSQSLLDQLSGKSDGLVISGGALGGGAEAGRGSAAPSGVATGLALVFVASMDADKNGALSRSEFVDGFNRWFEAWNADRSGSLTRDQIVVGLGKLFPQPAQ